jgi:hypothetical protein
LGYVSGCRFAHGAGFDRQAPSNGEAFAWEDEMLAKAQAAEMATTKRLVSVFIELVPMIGLLVRPVVVCREALKTPGARSSAPHYLHGPAAAQLGSGSRKEG